MKASVIIPTYNRKEYLRDCLDSLAGQSCPKDWFDVIVVDDGSNDGTEEVVELRYPFEIHYVRQANQGDAAARNRGAQLSKSEYLLLLDDDMVVGPDYIECLLAELELLDDQIVIGTEYLWLDDSTPSSDLTGLDSKSSDGCLSSVEHPFAEVYSRNMSLSRQDYYRVGPMESFGFPGSNIWCDVDFTYRAYQLGFTFVRNMRAICYHRDYVARDMVNAKRRAREMAYRAVVMFQKHPQLLSYLPMFQDKTTVAWKDDPVKVILHKLVRPLASTNTALSGMEQLSTLLERYHPSSRLLRPLRRWILGGYHFQGYRQGLRDFTPSGNQHRAAPYKSQEQIDRLS